MVPLLEVAHLPPSSSFYAAVLQPLGIRYLASGTDPCPNITFGRTNSTSGNEPLLQIRQIKSPPKPSSIVLAAPSAASVSECYRIALLASADGNDREGGTSRRKVAPASNSDPTATNQGGAHAVLRHAPETNDIDTDHTSGSIEEAKITDFDGNTMSIQYVIRESERQPDGRAVRRTQSSPKDAARIENWNFGVAKSEADSDTMYDGGSSYGTRDDQTLAPSRRQRPHYDESYDYDSEAEARPTLTRRVTTTTTRSLYEDPTVVEAPSRQGSRNLIVPVVTALAGFAIGSAAVAAAMNSDRSRAPRQEFDAAPPLSRRQTFPDRDHIVQVKRSIKKVEFPGDGPDYVACYSQVPMGRSKEYDDVYDDNRSRRSSRSRPSSSSRTHSETGRDRKQLLLAETEHRSQAGSAKGSSYYPPAVRRTYTTSAIPTVEDKDSYVSAQSHRSGSTIRPAPPQQVSVAPGQYMQTQTRSRSGSRVATTIIEVGESPKPRAPSRTYSSLSARKVPLPPSSIGSGRSRRPSVSRSRSGLGTSRVDWDEDEDADSIGPDDSISNVGSRRSDRSHISHY